MRDLAFSRPRALDDGGSAGAAPFWPIMHGSIHSEDSVMTSTHATLRAALDLADMLEIDGLYASAFAVGDHLDIECMDGRQRKVWRFSAAQVDAASFDTTLQSWVIHDDAGEHRIVCLEAFVGSDDGDDGDLD